MTMTLLFAAGDVGGARAILPVARQAQRDGHRVNALAHGVLRSEGQNEWTWLDFATAATVPVDAVIYATSVSDPLAFQLAMTHAAKGAPIVHVLDNWSNYANRLHGQDSEGAAVTCIPDIYCVMDDLAYKDAIEDGVPSKILNVTGHPDLSKLASEAKAQTQQIIDKGHDILFVSEPARADSGPADSETGRGYDETTASYDFADALADVLRSRQATATVRLSIASHPREDRTAVERRWRTLVTNIVARAGKDVSFAMVPPARVRDALRRASHVAGMSSILLYEAWLIGRPVLSVQPRLRQPSMSAIGRRDGAFLCTDGDSLRQMIHDWMSRSAPMGKGHAHLALHADAARATLWLTKERVEARHADIIKEPR